jgi:hypothetical protein
VVGEEVRPRIKGGSAKRYQYANGTKAMEKLRKSAYEQRVRPVYRESARRPYRRLRLGEDRERVDLFELEVNDVGEEEQGNLEDEEQTYLHRDCPPSTRSTSTLPIPSLPEHVQHGCAA